MIVVNEKFEDITNYDLDNGYLIDTKRVKLDVQPIDNRKKFVWSAEDYEPVKMYIPLPPAKASPMEKIEAQVAYTAMMTDTLMEE